MRVGANVKVQFDRSVLIDAMRNAAAAAINKGAASMQATMKKGLVALGPWKSSPGGYPGNSKGTLKSSIQIGPFAKPTSLYARVGSNVPHAYHMHYGVKAGAKLLTVPLNKKARDLLIDAKSVRNIPGLKFIPSKKGGGILVFPLKSSKRAKRKFIPMFVLKRAVAARPWVTLSMRDGKVSAITEMRRVYALEAKKIGRSFIKAAKAVQ